MTKLVAGAFAGDFVRSRVPPGYSVGMLLVLLALLILPLLYLALIAGMGWLLVWHVQHDVVWISGASELGYRSGKAVLLAGFLYVAVAVAGVICILFMTKPLFAPLPKQPPTVTLDPISQPALFALIHHICDLVGAPRPVVVEVDAQVNASASFRRGMASFFGDDLVLSIGMPLVAGLTARELAGVLAHEFGHFAQSGGMRLNYLVRSINHWFARVVLERDGWDERLDALCCREGYSGTMGNAARVMIWLGRKVMNLLMQAGGAISGFMSRQREYDADVYGAKVAGSQEMVDALLQVELLGQAEASLVKTLLTRMKEGELPDNVPGRIASLARAMPESLRKQVKSKALAEKASWRSTHPALKERQEKLKEVAAPGVCHLDLRAAELFHDFTGLCKTVSLHWYDVELGLDLNEFDLVDVNEGDRQLLESRDLIESRQRQEQEEENRRSAERQAAEHARKEQHRAAAVVEMFGHPPQAYRLLPVPMATPEDWAPAASMVKAWKAEYGPACEREKKQRDELCQRTLACHLLHLGHARAGPEAPAVMAAQAESLREHEITSKQLALFEQAAWTRITAALAWRFQQADALPMWREQVARLVEAQRALAAALPHLTAVWVDTLLLRHARGAAAQVRGDYETRVHAGMGGAMRALEAVANPYDPQGRPLAEALGPQQAPHLSDGGGPAESCTCLRDKVCRYADRVTSDLCLLAHEAECAGELALPHAACRTSSSSGWQPTAMAAAA